MSEDRKAYGLYVVMPQDIPSGERHYFITPDYSLLYTNNAPPERSAKVKSLQMLPQPAREWLYGCVNAIRAEYLAEHKGEIAARTSAFLAGFLRELEIERKALAANTETERE